MRRKYLFTTGNSEEQVDSIRVVAVSIVSIKFLIARLLTSPKFDVTSAFSSDIFSKDFSRDWISLSPLLSLMKDYKISPRF